jgi:hypothetical protein
MSTSGYSFHDMSMTGAKYFTVFTRTPFFGGIGRASACIGGGKAEAMGLEGQLLMPPFAN